MEYESAKFWVQIVALLINLGIWSFVYISNRSKVTRERIQELEVSLATDFARMDERLKSALSHAELKPVYDRINSVDKQLGEISGKMHTLDLIHEMLLNGDK